MNAPRLLPGAAHFIVIEDPAYAPLGEGEHLYVQIEKEDLNTDQVAEALAKACGKRAMDVGYAGRKDRHAVAQQWFSIHFGDEAQLSGLGEHLRGHGRATVLAVSRHRNKLRLGHLAGNRFRLGIADADPAILTAGLDRLARDGIRHRFGPQRFGIGGATLRLAQAWGAGDHAAAVAAIVDPMGAWRFGDPLPGGYRHGPEGRVLGALRRRENDAAGALAAAGDQLRKLAASAAQSAIFNAVLDARIEAGLLYRLRAGDVAMLGSGAPFVVAEADVIDVNRRAAPGLLAVVPTGPLPGESRLRPTSEIEAEERRWSAATGIDWDWFSGAGTLTSPGERRPLLVSFRAPPTVTVEDGLCRIELALPAGCYATEVLDQIGVTVPADRRG